MCETASQNVMLTSGVLKDPFPIQDPIHFQSSDNEFNYERILPIKKFTNTMVVHNLKIKDSVSSQFTLIPQN